MPQSIEFIFDFASPNAYMAYRVLPAIAKRTGARIQIIPCLLGGIFKLTNNQSPMAAFGQVKGKLEYEQLETQRFISKHHLQHFQWNPHFPLNSLLIMRGLIAAERCGVAEPYLEHVCVAMWERGEKMDDPAVVERVLRTAGLDASALLALTQDPTVKAELWQTPKPLPIAACSACRRSSSAKRCSSAKTGWASSKSYSRIEPHVTADQVSRSRRRYKTR